MTVQEELAPLALLDVPPVPAGFREPFDEAVDDVAVWMVFVRTAGELVLDDDIEHDRDWQFWWDWERMLLVERVGLDAVEHVLTTREGRAPLYERGPSVTIWQPPTSPTLAVPGVTDHARELPRPLSREEIDQVLDYQLQTWPRRQSLDELWHAYDQALITLAIFPRDPGAQAAVRRGTALLEFEGVAPDPHEDAAIQAAVRAIPSGQPWPTSYAAYRASRR
jgi:hypothetical protein